MSAGGVGVAAPSVLVKHGTIEARCCMIAKAAKERPSVLVKHGTIEAQLGWQLSVTFGAFRAGEARHY